MLKQVIALTIASICIVVMPPTAGALTFNLYRVADLTTAIPGGIGNFTSFVNSQVVAISGRHVAFHYFDGAQQGVYLFDGSTLSRVVDLNTPIPNGIGTFTAFGGGGVPLSGSKMLIWGVGRLEQRGLYFFDGGTLSRVADTATAIPGGIGHFSSFGGWALSGSSVAFIGCSVTPFCGLQQLGQKGIYFWDGDALSRVVDLNTPIPNGTGTFTGVGDPESPSLSGRHVAFQGSGASGQEGVYLFDGTALSRVADLETPVPHGEGTFTRLSVGIPRPVVSDGKVAFLGLGLEQQGIYLSDGITLSRVADLSTQIPNGIGSFVQLSSPAFSGGNVAFPGEGDSGQQGIYSFEGTTLSRVADLSTPIPGGTGTFTSLQYFSNPPFKTLDQRVLAFCGYGQTGQEGIYLFDGATVSRVADLHTPIPGGTGTFTALNPTFLFGVGCVAPQVSGNSVAFIALGEAGQQGIYLAVPTNATNTAPVANAGSDQTVRPGSLVRLDGAGSRDPDMGPDPLTFAWTQSAGPVSVSLQNATTSAPTFMPAVPGHYVFGLVVGDGAASSSATVSIMVPQIGDIDGNGAVNLEDLGLVSAALNKPAVGPNDLRDLNGDGKINALDARILVTTCSKPRCAL